MSELTDQEYGKVAEDTLNRLLVFLEDISDNLDIEEIDVEYTQGVLTLSVGYIGTYVINKQPPNKQIWLSSPISGPERYDFDQTKNAWFCRHTDESLGALLTRELSKALKQELELPIK
ncbi:Frataxin [Coemansia reversa NRRL 1564]|uniref:ferroxidase n=1 Tax=Coemansia reversa (strain ATCC 12441 / NRRL 1564) TaxID=763665 RepID=A0A2G5BG31_COERN|nr:Frataxin [Coemansia reversa NRRL 1564]|eukprot:PIA17969.1 Frataxin [Coemansia reversa NRRL 1564]